jgi:cell wall-associated NlpC family hydrolase
MCWHGRRKYHLLSGFPSPLSSGAVTHEWDSRECPGPTTEAELSRPSTRRALTAGAIALAVIAPSVEIADQQVQAAAPPVSSSSSVARTPVFDPIVTLGRQTADRTSRAAARGPSAAHRAEVRPAVAAVRKAVRQAARREAIKISEARERRIAQDRARRIKRAEAQERRAEKRTATRVVTRSITVRKRSATVRRAKAVVPRMAAVIAYARAQIGKRYASGGEGPNSFDCSGFTKRAYALAGLRLPHSSGAQAARARRISRAQARAGDLVVGPGHVGIYMGNGMMIDAGNRRTGVVYRRLYAGLSVARF